jgi:hypothetical protein
MMHQNPLQSKGIKQKMDRGTLEFQLRMRNQL